MTKLTNRREENEINSCILRSKDLVLLIRARHANRRTQSLTVRTLKSLRSNGYCKEIDDELKERIDDHRLSIARLLKPIFMVHNIPFKVRKQDGRQMFWFSEHDLKNGYVILYKLVFENTATHVLFLSDYDKHPFNEAKAIKAGEIHPYEEVAHILPNVEPAWKNQTIIQLLKLTKSEDEK